MDSRRTIPVPHNCSSLVFGPADRSRLSFSALGKLCDGLHLGSNVFSGFSRSDANIYEKVVAWFEVRLNLLVNNGRLYIYRVD